MIKNSLKRIYFTLADWSLTAANRQVNRLDLIKELKKIVPDITDQYTTWSIKDTNSFDARKIRSIHAFQVSIVMRALEEELGSRDAKTINIADIGDSAGTHSKYIHELSARLGVRIDMLSINMDRSAVEKIRMKGGRAIESKAEDVHKSRDLDRGVDIFLSFQMLEHLLNPALFMHDLAVKTETEVFVVTVPYVKKSRVGLKYLRCPKHTNKFEKINAENTHILELSPEDWRLLLMFSGWKVSYEERFLMYPTMSPLYFFKYPLRHYDFEGFLGFILKRDLSKSNIYQDW